jgi:uncharacterized membrane protein YbaN (DUF454 family)
MFESCKKVILITIGFISVFFAIAGVFLPLLPTTPFLLLALACFARSSKKFHSMLLNNRYFGATINNWQQHKCIEKAVKIKAYCFILFSFSVSIYFVEIIYLKIMLLIMMLGLLCFLYNTAEKKTTS